jgi:hypothetical protein
MVKVHPGLGLWRSILGESLAEASRELALETACIDVTLTTGNLHSFLSEAAQVGPQKQLPECPATATPVR